VGGWGKSKGSKDKLDCVRGKKVHLDLRVKSQRTKQKARVKKEGCFVCLHAGLL
jgi:ribosomal protein S13